MRHKTLFIAAAALAAATAGCSSFCKSGDGSDQKRGGENTKLFERGRFREDDVDDRGRFLWPRKEDAIEDQEERLRRESSKSKGGDAFVEKSSYSATTDDEFCPEETGRFSDEKRSLDVRVEKRDRSAAKGGYVYRERETERIRGRIDSEMSESTVSAPLPKKSTGLLPGRSDDPSVEQAKCDWRDIDSQRVDFHPTR